MYKWWYSVLDYSFCFNGSKDVNVVNLFVRYLNCFLLFRNVMSYLGFALLLVGAKNVVLLYCGV